MATNPQNLVILDIEETEVAEKQSGIITYFKGFLQNNGAISLRQKVVFFRIMATMTNASMTVLKSLSALRRQEKNKRMMRFYDFMIEKIQSWYSLNEWLRSYYGNFSDAECSIIEAGERTGKLNAALLQIAEQTEKLDSITRKVKWALTYPALLVIGMTSVIIILMTKVMPSLLVFFGDPETLPSSTQFILGISAFLENTWILLLVLLITGIIGIVLWKKTKNGKYTFDKIMLHIPIFGGIIQKVILSKFSRVFANLIGSGVAIVEAIRIVASAVGNEVYRQRILLLRQDVRNGMKMAESLENDPLFPELLIAMLRVGEETAQVGNTVVKIADFYDEEVDIAINSIQKLIEPLILIVMGIAIGFLSLGIFEPIMGLAETIGI